MPKSKLIGRISLALAVAAVVPLAAAQNAGSAKGSDPVAATATIAGTAASSRAVTETPDPLGTLLMSYPPEATPRAILTDLERLLKLSHIG